MKDIKYILLALTALVATATIKAQTRYCDKIEGEYIIEKQYLTISYNIDGKIPNYVGYFLTKQNLEGNIARESKFYAESTLPARYQSRPSDYTRSGYDRGHMSPAGDWHFSKPAMHDSFSMANICPQAPQLNRIYWKSIETEEREDITKCDTLFVISGEICASDNKVSKGFKEFQKVSCGYIKNGVRIPTQFYKTIIGVKNHKVVLTKAWLFNNTNDKQPANSHTTTIQAIERLIHQDLYHQFWFNK